MQGFSTEMECIWHESLEYEFTLKKAAYFTKITSAAYITSEPQTKGSKSDTNIYTGIIPKEEARSLA